MRSFINYREPFQARRSRAIHMAEINTHRIDFNFQIKYVVSQYRIFKIISRTSRNYNKK